MTILKQKPKTLIVAAGKRDLIALANTEPAVVKTWVDAMQDKAAKTNGIHCRPSLVRAGQWFQSSLTEEDIRPFCDILLPTLPPPIPREMLSERKTRTESLEEDGTEIIPPETLELETEATTE